MTLTRFTHANHESVVYIVKELIGGWYHSPGNGCTHIVLTGGAVFPAKESLDEVTRRLSGVVQGSGTPEVALAGGKPSKGRK